MRIAEADLLNLSGRAWRPIPRLSRTIPFGYNASEDDPDVLIPNIFELEALEQAKKHVKKGVSYKAVRDWLVSITNRNISAQGLQKRINSDARRRSKAEALAGWARTYKEAIQKAQALDERLGNSTEAYMEALQALDRISANTD